MQQRIHMALPFWLRVKELAAIQVTIACPDFTSHDTFMLQPKSMLHLLGSGGCNSD